ncbi:glycosyltransferase family 2 protein [Salinirussus salinus]|uniref:glycosyltransferase family 2 protein n=1 Tax=Salinirussus salinus TaxID=1198300 RepID=UPI00135BDDA6|nr:glycosyltransferase family A protein [Salinirussus salinus]
MRAPLVSTIIPTYNRPNQFAEALESVNRQTYENIEVVIVDDGSDKTYANRIASNALDTDSYIICEHDTNQGVAVARNTGIKDANGEYIAFLDDDDVWKESKIEKQIASLENDDRSFCYTWLKRVDEDGTVTGRSTKTSTGMVRTEVPDGGFPGPPAVCVKKDVFDDIGYFNESLDVFEDVEFGLRMADNYEYSCVPDTLVVASSVNHVSSEYVMKKQQAVQKILDWHTPLPERFGPKATERFRSRLYRGLGITALKAGEYSIARKSLHRSIREYPSQRQAYVYALAALCGKFTHKPLLFLKRAAFDQNNN